MEKLIHLLIPRESNNHKAKLLHSTSLLLVSSFLILFQFAINYADRVKPDVLGYGSSISRSEVAKLTNARRTAAGLSELTFNETLSSAAYTKGVDMINKDYWAHVAPDGTEPWAFFNSFGYKYRYAGENLARDFSSASAAVDAWMNSPTHRDNILNPKYKEIGIGIVEGDLAGSDTTIIVQFFGTSYADNVKQPLAINTDLPATQTQNVVGEIDTPTSDQNITKTVEEKKPVQTPVGEVQSVISQPKPEQKVLISPFTTTKTMSLAVVGILLLVFVVDAALVSKRRITRIAGRSLAHVIFLGMVLSIIVILKSGRIM